MAKEFGVNFNCSLIESNGDKDLGVNIETSEGLKLNSEIKGDNWTDMINAAYDELLEGYLDFQAKKDAEEEKQPEEIDHKLFSAELDNAILKDRIKELNNRVNSLSEENKKLQKIIKDKNIDKNNKKEYNNNVRKNDIYPTKEINEFYKLLSKYF